MRFEDRFGPLEVVLPDFFLVASMKLPVAGDAITSSSCLGWVKPLLPWLTFIKQRSGAESFKLSMLIRIRGILLNADWGIRAIEMLIEGADESVEANFANA